jgi:hypothetical protein
MSSEKRDPEPDELAAVVAAVELLWPRAASVHAEPVPSRWRFAGRWWSKPIPSRRERPF